MVSRSRPAWLETWLAGGRSRLVSAALLGLSLKDIRNIVGGLPYAENPASAPEIDSAAEVDGLPELAAFAAYLVETSRPPEQRLAALRAAWLQLDRKRPALWTADDIFGCMMMYAVGVDGSVSRLAQAANLFWLSHAAEPFAAEQRARLIDFVEGAIVLTELRQAGLIPQE